MTPSVRADGKKGGKKSGKDKSSKTPTAASGAGKPDKKKLMDLGLEDDDLDDVEVVMDDDPAPSLAYVPTSASVKRPGSSSSATPTAPAAAVWGGAAGKSKADREFEELASLASVAKPKSKVGSMADILRGDWSPVGPTGKKGPDRKSVV